MARSVVVALVCVLAFLPLHFPGIGAAAVVVSDDAGRRVALEVPARRIVSFYAGHSENLMALDVWASSRPHARATAAGLAPPPLLVGISEGDDESLFPDATRLPMRADAERILALAPDLVLVRPLVESVNEGVFTTLERIGIPVVSLSPPLPGTMESYLERLGALVGIEDGGALWRETLALIEPGDQPGPSTDVRPRVFLETTGKGVRTCSPSSWAAFLISLAGGENAAASAIPPRPESPLAPWGEERLLELAEERLDVYLVQVGAMNPVSEEEVRSRPWIGGLRGARIVLVEEEMISRPSLLRMRGAVEFLRTILNETEPADEASPWKER